MPQLCENVLQNFLPRINIYNRNRGAIYEILSSTFNNKILLFPLLEVQNIKYKIKNDFISILIHALHLLSSDCTGITTVNTCDTIKINIFFLLINFCSTLI